MKDILPPAPPTPPEEKAEVKELIPPTPAPDPTPAPEALKPFKEQEEDAKEADMEKEVVKVAEATPAPTPTPTSTPEPTPAPTTPAPTPSPTKYQLLLRVTTGKEPYADSNMKVKLVITGSLDKYTGYFYGGSKGQVKTSTLHPPGDIGEVKHVTISSKSGNGWYFTKFEVKSGNLDWTQVGCTDQWLDGKIDHTPYGGSGLYGTHIELHPIQEHCAASVPEDWGTRTKEGCFCKNHGKSGKCSKHGSSYAWCKTMNGCKGHGSSNPWDKCTPGPKDQ